MTDLRKFIELYQAMGITVVPTITNNPPGGFSFAIIKEDHSSIIGDASFTTYYFDQNERFVSQGVWK
jgi:hypothetical protein